MKEVIGTYEAKTKFTELLREVRKGRHFTITHRGEEVAEIGPIQMAEKRRATDAARQLLEFTKTRPRVTVDIKALIEHGRD
ncbi:MAG TPA: type II toxin-antitoxin system prevent-host-death family antitoxin [Pyrinomonadaceae bacterium]|jgi:prevent-host-death family protein